MKILLLLSCIMMACNQPAGKMALDVEERYVLETFPSGSGMVLDKDHAYIISDDAPNLLTINLSSKELLTTPITGLDTGVQRIPKPLKPDYEALCRLTIEGKDFLLAFGSGSISPFRDSLLVISMDAPTVQQKVPLTQLYQQLRGNNAVINIEGATCSATDIYLLDREHNQLHRFPIASMVELITTNGRQLPKRITTHSLSIPGAFTTRLSGASLLDDSTMLFCASMEDTPDAVADGKIYGSYIGLLDLNEMKITAIAPVMDPQGQALPDKLESVSVAGKNSDGSYRIWAVADNDTGNTVLFRLLLHFKK